MAAVHPDRLAVLGRLHGIDAVPVDRCRVLEVGCGDGSNLVPIAAAFPESRFIGLDLSSRAVERAREYARACGLGNIEFRNGSLDDPEAVDGLFDYVLCHGVYSWVPAEVRAALLRLLQRVLSPAGLAFVSYNALPGWSLHQPTRDLLRWHLRDILEPAERLEEARALSLFLSRAIPEVQPAPAALRAEFGLILERTPSVLLHDELAEHHQAFYLHEFVAAAASEGLVYVADSDLGEHLLKGLDPETVATLDAVASTRIEREQYLDFLIPRRFRQSIVGRSECQPTAELDPRRLEGCFFSAGTPGIGRRPSDTAPGAIRFERPGGGPSLESDFAPGLEALDRLIAAYPRRIPFAVLWGQILDSIATSLSGVPEAAFLRESLLRFLFDAAAGGFVSWHTVEPRGTRTPGERPVAFVPARVRAADGVEIPNLQHRVLRLEERWTRELLVLCDGRRDRPQLLAELESRVTAAGELGDPAWNRIQADPEGTLRRLADLALFVA